MAFLFSVPVLAPIRPRPPPTHRRTPIATISPTPLPRGQELYRPPAAALHPSGPLTASDLDFFYTNGYVLVRNLLSGPLLAAARASTGALDNEDISITRAAYNRLTFDVSDHAPIFRRIATTSRVARAVAQLLPSTIPGPRARVVLKDAYFKLTGSKPVCNFHVDDVFFWPCADDQPGPGVNVWIALDTVDHQGGGLTIAPASHTEHYLDCRDAIKEDTCTMHQSNPDALAKLERIAISPHFQPGDALLCTRWLFHRGNPFKAGTPGEAGPGVRRYSARYMPGEAVTNPVLIKDGRFAPGEPIALQHADPELYPSLDLD